jgi:hypothetical protein
MPERGFPSRKSRSGKSLSPVGGWMMRQRAIKLPPDFGGHRTSPIGRCLSAEGLSVERDGLGGDFEKGSPRSKSLGRKWQNGSPYLPWNPAKATRTPRSARFLGADEETDCRREAATLPETEENKAVTVYRQGHQNRMASKVVSPRVQEPFRLLRRRACLRGTLSVGCKACASGASIVFRLKLHSANHNSIRIRIFDARKFSSILTAI